MTTTSKPAKHPMQPVQIDKDGTPRFLPNKIVRFLLDAGPFDLNQLAMMGFSDEDREQFAQLIGYSIGGYAELSYVSDRSYNKAERLAKKTGFPWQQGDEAIAAWREENGFKSRD